VAPDDSDAVALVEPDGDPVEDDTGGIFEVKGLGAQEMCHRMRLPAGFRSEARFR
ncbi:MAG: hypothetical protein JWN09_27, partial [Microbacteriaceae bacterium]|nr:hypothetical protein [Microbacteriaceae bacterium]